MARSHSPRTPRDPHGPQDPRASRPTISQFAKQHTVLLTTYKRDGTPVGTAVSMAVEGDHAYIRTYGSAWKAKRMRNNPVVAIAPATLSGRPTGPSVPARTHLLKQGSGEARHAARMLTRKHPVLHGVLVPLGHRLKHETTLHYEVRLVAEDERYPEAGGTGPAPGPATGPDPTG
ncbi:PPOX class F420-dependent oxidoreductase [Streptomyces sp. NPDC018031]|uniref:PPOX class F420-dependent oxidoreductase n=1 Tax=Streptomyces sp. NPDC018031 TaxID=3365033 RepID=UPI0037AB4141